MSAVLSFLPRPAGAQPVLTVREVARQYLENKELEAQAGLICADLLTRLKRHLGDFTEGPRGDLPADGLRGTDVTRWILSHANWHADSYRLSAARSVQGAFTWATDEGILTRNPIRKLKPCWGTPQPRGAILPDEFRGILDAARSCDGRERRARPGRHAFRVAFWFLAQTGCRTCEMREALWSQVDWKAGILRLPKNKTSRKTAQARLIPLTRHVLWLLRWLERRKRPGQTHLFVTSRGGPWTCRNFDALAAEFRELAGVRAEATPYTLRHGWTVAGLERGEGERQLADVLGHTSTRYVAWYGKDVTSRADYLRGIAERVQKGQGGDAKK